MRLRKNTNNLFPIRRGGVIPPATSGFGRDDPAPTDACNVFLRSLKPPPYEMHRGWRRGGSKPPPYGPAFEIFIMRSVLAGMAAIKTMAFWRLVSAPA